MDPFTRAYLECALWLATGGENGEIQLDDLYTSDDFAPEAVAQAETECAAFQADNAADLAEYYRLTDCGPESAGHDFFLTRNGHGAGFWDRGAGRAGDRLTAACRYYGDATVYVGNTAAVDPSRPLYIFTG